MNPKMNPKMNLSKLPQLKQTLLEASDLSEVWSFYMDNFTDLPEFVEVGEPKQNQMLEAIIPQVCEQLFGRKVKISHLLLIYIAEYQFFHAPFAADRRIGGLIYFEDIHTGMIAVSADYPPTDLVKYSRFSSSPWSPGDRSHAYN